MDRRELDRNLNDLKRIIDCTNCPIDSHCCNFSKDYFMHLSRASVDLAFSETEKKALLLEGKLVEGKRRYQLEARCPFLNEHNACDRYFELDALGFKSCKAFPIYSFEEKGTIKIMVHYKCPELQRKSEQITAEMERLMKQGFSVEFLYPPQK